MTSEDKVQDLYFQHRVHVEQLEAEINKMRVWINDLQAGMYINCVYCGHRYGPDDEMDATMANALKEHIERCPKHPMSDLKNDVRMFRTAAEKWQRIAKEWERENADLRNELREYKAKVNPILEELNKEGLLT